MWELGYKRWRKQKEVIAGGADAGTSNLLALVAEFSQKAGE